MFQLFVRIDSILKNVKSELSQGILVTSPTRLAGVDCKQTKMFDFGLISTGKLGGFYVVQLWKILWV